MQSYDQALSNWLLNAIDDPVSCNTGTSVFQRKQEEMTN